VKNGGTVLPCKKHFNRNYTLYATLFVDSFADWFHTLGIASQSPSSSHLMALIAGQFQTIATCDWAGNYGFNN
jgi:hypothetical protein